MIICCQRIYFQNIYAFFVEIKNQSKNQMQLMNFNHLQNFKKQQLHINIIKGTFLSESTDVFVIKSNRQTFVLPETENLNFGGF